MATQDDDRTTDTTTTRDDAATRAEDTTAEERRDERRAETHEERRAGTPFTQQLGRVLVAVILVLFGIFAVANAQPVAFDWIFGETDVQQVGDTTRGGVPLILLLLASFVLGGLAGWFATWRSSRRS